MKNIVFGILLIVFLVLPNSIKAVEEEGLYKTYHDVTYFLQEGSQTRVIHNVKIELNEKYEGIRKIEFKEPTDDITNLELIKEDPQIEIQKINNFVEINFKDLLVGPITKDTSYSYDTEELFKRVGTTYSLNIPTIEESETIIQEFNLKIYLPKELHDNKNLNFEIFEDENGKYISLKREELENLGSSITFGESIYYNIEVTNVIDSQKDYIVVIPAIEGRQKSINTYISEKPNRVKKDPDGNLLAYFLTQHPKTVTTKYTVEVYGNKSKVNENIRTYKKPIKNWNYKVGLPAYFLKNIESGEEAYFKVKDFLNYAPEKRNYNYIHRIGAENLNEENRNQAVCLEYSDLLISLFRGLGIPSREINGFTYIEENQQDSQLHSWVEYVDKNNEWVQVDPTWGDTSKQNYLENFDLYHINFLRRGTNSEYPILQGSYKNKILAENVKVTVLKDKPGDHKINFLSSQLGPLKITKNDTLNTVKTNAGIFNPYQTKIHFTENLKAEQDNIILEIKQENIISIIPNMAIYMLAILLMSPLIFFLAHKKLQQFKKRVRDKVRSIV